jgi:putative hydrolase of the HAD superfamily
VDAVVLDLFGTLVAAPTPADRAQAAVRLATAAGCNPSAVENYLDTTWRSRHDGTLPTLTDLATDLARAVRGSASAVIEAVADELRRLGQARLIPTPSVAHVLTTLRDQRLRLGVLSDASPEVAAAWPHSPLSALVDIAVFSCQAGSVKPDQLLYRRVRDQLDTPADQILYVGDGGGDELIGALTAGMTAVAVRRRGPAAALAFNARDWHGPILDAVEQVPAYLADLR